MAKKMTSITGEPAGHVRLLNHSGATLEQGDFAILRGFAAIADYKVEDGEIAEFAVAEGLRVQTSALHATAARNAFSLDNQDVYWDPATKTFSGTKDAAFYKVGTLVTPKTDQGWIEFDKFRHAIPAA